MNESIMRQTDLNNLIASGANVTISVTAEQLRQAFLEWGERLLEAVKPQEEDALLTIKEAAEYVGVSVGTIHNRIRGGWLHAGRNGNVIRIKKSDLDKVFSH